MREDSPAAEHPPLDHGTQGSPATEHRRLDQGAQGSLASPAERVRRALDADRMRAERVMQRVRFGGVIIGTVIALSMWGDDRSVSLLVTGVVPLGLTAVLVHLVMRRGDRRSVRWAGVVAMVGDSIAVTLTLFTLLDDPADPVPILSLVVALEAAARWGLPGGVIGGMGAGLLGGTWVVASHRNVGLEAPIEYVISQSTITLLFGAIVGQLNRLRRASQTVLELSPDLIATIDSDSIVRTVNAASLELLGVAPEYLVGRDYRELLDPAPGEEFPEGDLVELLGPAGGRGTAQRRFRHADGREVWMELGAQEERADGRIYVVGRDVTLRRLAERELEASEQRLRVLFDRNLDAVVALDLEGRLIDTNTAFFLLTGRSTEDEDEGELILADLVDHTDHPVLDEMLADARRGRPVDGELTLVSIDGSSRQVEVDLLPILSGDRVTGLFGLLRDVSEIRRREARLAYEVSHDPLTGLSNRMALQQELDAAVAAGQPTALLFVDLDGFKTVNDTYGHAAGDRVLIAMGERLTEAVREDDFVARLAGDEFCAVLHGADVDSADIIARRIEDRLRRPIDLGPRTVSISGSVGIAVLQPGESPADLLARADERMYEVKERRRQDPDAAIVRPERRRLRRAPRRPE